MTANKQEIIVWCYRCLAAAMVAKGSVEKPQNEYLLRITTDVLIELCWPHKIYYKQHIILHP